MKHTDINTDCQVCGDTDAQIVKFALHQLAENGQIQTVRVCRKCLKTAIETLDLCSDEDKE